MSDEEMTKKGLRYMLAQMATRGVGTVRAEDGQFFAFGVQALERLLEEARASDDKMVVVFVKAGGSVEEIKEN